MCRSRDYLCVFLYSKLRFCKTSFERKSIEGEESCNRLRAGLLQNKTKKKYKEFQLANAASEAITREKAGGPSPESSGLERLSFEKAEPQVLTSIATAAAASLQSRSR